MHDGSAVRALLQDDNVIGRQKVRARAMVLVCKSLNVCVLVGDIGGIIVGQQSAAHSLCHNVLPIYSILHRSGSNPELSTLIPVLTEFFR